MKPACLLARMLRSIRAPHFAAGSLLAALCVALGLAMLAALAVGGVPVPIADVVSALLGNDDGSLHHNVIVAIRLPRVLLAATVGAGLACSGAVLQGLFRNPLVDPTFIGATSGAAMGAALAIVFGAPLALLLPPLVRPWLISLASMIGCFALLRVALGMSRVQGRVVIAQLLLVGIALAALAGTVMGLCVTFADDAQARTITFWTLGSLGGASLRTLMLVAPVTAIGIVLLLPHASALDAMTLGEAEAANLGVDVDRVKRRALVLVAIIVGVSVSMVGQIGFVGIVVPQLVRLSFGSRHRPLLVGSVVGGALLLVLADTVARTVVLPAELPIGIVTGALGAPFFLVLLRRRSGALA